MARGISLANKCQLGFGLAILLIIGSALLVPWVRLVTIVDQSQVETSRQIARVWAQAPWLDENVGWFLQPSDADPDAPESELLIGYWPVKDWERTQFQSAFLQAAKRRFAAERGGAAGGNGGGGLGPNEHEPEYVEVLWDANDRVYRFARVVPEDRGIADGSGAGGEGPGIRGVIVVERRSTTAASQLFVNRMYLLAAGAGAGALAFLVFYVITTRIILSPVRALRDTTELVRAGNLNVRSDIRTGDEFEQLSEAFNSMLANLGEQQAQLRGTNRSLDLKLVELAEINVGLHEAARMKGEFLARISHELRTPLNSIIGFAEILQDLAQSETDHPERSGDPERLAKRKRYLENIVSAGRTLLEMINELLTMARIDAGKIELHVQAMNVAETCDGLLALIRPLAERKRIRLSLQLQAPRGGGVLSAAGTAGAGASGRSDDGGGFTSDPAAADLPSIETDPQKFQQVIFNFLSNAVKFTPEEGEVTLRAERLVGNDGVQRLRVSVLDTGPGIPREMHEEIFNKFTQLEAGHTRQHQGTGLGLSIAKEFAAMLGGEIQLVSEVGRGSMFSLIVPLTVARTAVPA